jgi:hypothetical protein
VRDPGNRPLTAVAVAVTAVLLAASPAAAIDRDGDYRGLTSQNRPVRFTVEDREIRNVRLSAFHEACNLAVVATSGDITFAIADDNTFVMKFFANQRRDKIVVRGEFTSRIRARGTFRSVQDNRDCQDIVRGTWSVERIETAA